MKHLKTKLLTATLLSILGVTTFAVLPTYAEAEKDWGPTRQTYSWDHPADKVTINSITDNPTLGDEENFVRVREYGTNDTYSDNVDIEPGKTYEVYVYYHNNAKASMNADGSGIAKDVRLRMEAPEAVEAGSAAVIKGIITSTNADPNEVWDKAYLHTNEIVYLRYVDGSAVIHNGGSSNGKVLSDNALWDDRGVLLSYYDNYLGLLPGCNEFAGYVTFQIKADQPGFYMEKTGKISGSENDYSQYISAHPGDTLDFKIRYHNTGTTNQMGVVLYDELGQGLNSIAGTTHLTTPTSDGDESSEALFGGGLNIGDYASGQEATVTYRVQIADDQTIFPCGETVVYNLAGASTANGTIHDKVKVTVTRDCEGGVVVKTCKDDPTMEGCQELPNTGPAEIVMAIIIAVGILGGGIYFVRTQAKLKKLETTTTAPKDDMNSNSDNGSDNTSSQI